ncbi:tetratricopeptide repeat protein [Halalkalibacterium halodurans]|jgi:tetratricopeptide (TPR) repeat protein|uniref:Uncharacterized protein n=2 Tax=Halalkalibacterium halodurans TaxID=86665 RepID=A0A0M0KKB8_ALKHA|nr:tetratricopeptide repeat protein [Halalkalibacterium halodurans]MDY7222240.1 tetratricopeptide repeat protein [Halalkalibacterium halodurans]MDY7241461.1 tetratricopeptide repeat protein [Halalkalibacterium halodurans]MED4123872.1 tetratricopeptide repeat protein [Halalkalibacterium halodurans]MED4173108.1 tetratricopeptide repeat protein [Halalkalibacterium halodurans]TPE70591.1 tetratricopeptide repeat protein [Halalkalibacterium halodurans]
MRLIEQAIEKIESGQVTEGLTALEEAAKTANHEMKYTVAETYYELGHLDKAQAIIDELLMLYPDEGGLYTFAAEILIDLNKEDEAIEMLNEIKEQDPAFLQAQLLLADLYQLQSLDEVAEQKLLKAYEVAPDEPIISFGLGEFYLERGDYIKSIPHLKRAKHGGLTNDQVNVSLKLAEAYSGSGQFEEALPHYDEGLKQKLDPHGLFGYGYTAYLLGDYVLAIEQFQALKALDPDFTTLYPYLAKALEGENRLEEAMDVLKEGMIVDEYNETLYVHAGKLSFKMQQPSKGEAFLRKTIALNPANVEAVRTLAAYLKHEGRFEALVELIEHVKGYGEEDPLFTWYEAAALKEGDQFKKAYELYQEISVAFSEDPDFLEEYGDFLLEYGDRAKALEQYRAALTVDPHRLHVKERIYELELQGEN